MFSFKVSREHIFKVSIAYLTYPNHHAATQISHGSRDYCARYGKHYITFLHWVNRYSTGEAKSANFWIEQNWRNQQLRLLWYLQGSLNESKRMWRQDASRYTISRQFKGLSQNQKNRCYDNNIFNQIKCNQKGFWLKVCSTFVSWLFKATYISLWS